MKFNYRQVNQPVIQREMPFFMPVADRSIKTARFVPAEIVNSWSCYRDAVIWCWDNRPHTGGNSSSTRLNKNGDEMLFASISGAYPSHVSRFFKRDSNSPMDLKADLISAFQAFTQWKGVSQYLSKQSELTIMEELIDMKRAA